MSDDQKEAVWDLTRACFKLIAVILLVNLAVGSVIAIGCGYGVLIEKMQQGLCENARADIKDLMTFGVAVLLAFAGKK